MAEPYSVARGLEAGLHQQLPRLDAQLLLLHALGRHLSERAWLISHADNPLTETQQQRLQHLYARRLAGEPVAYILGIKEFFGVELTVDARVLVPRPETETLVEWALEVLSESAPARVVDLGTGSGAVALALKQQKPGLDVWAVDQSGPALEIARENAQRLKLAIHWVQASWLSPWIGQANRWDAIVSNPPYIRRGDPHLPALQHEPISALVAGDDGLDDIRQIIQQATTCLTPGGHLLLEHGYDQAAQVRALLSGAGFTQVVSRQDLQGIERCSGGVLPKMK